MKRVFLVVLLLTVTARAEDWTVGGKVYSGVKVINHDDAFVTILDSDGGAKLALSSLPPELQKRFGYDPAKAAAAQVAAANQDKRDKAALAVEQRKATAQRQSRMVSEATEIKQEQDDTALKASAREINVKVIQVLPEGLLCEELEWAADGASYDNGQRRLLNLEETGNTWFVSCPSQGHSEGESLSVKAAKSGTYTYRDTAGASRTVAKWVVVSE